VLRVRFLHRIRDERKFSGIDELKAQIGRDSQRALNYFHRAGVSYAEAYADFRDCYRFLPVRDALYGYVPGFRLWTRRNAVGPYQPPPNNYGLVGGVILAMIAGPLDRRDRQSRMRRCMEPRGYVRYPLREEIWRQLIDNYSPRSIAMQALAASGPAPDLPPVTR